MGFICDVGESFGRNGSARRQETQPVVGLASLLTGDVGLRDEIGAALTRLGLLDIGAYRRARAEQLVGKGSANARSLIERPAQFHNASRELERTRQEVALGLERAGGRIRFHHSPLTIHYSPVNVGWRFSTKARAASMWSLVWPERIMLTASASRAVPRSEVSARLRFSFIRA